MLNYKTIKEFRFSSNYQRVPILQQLSKSSDSPATIKECRFSSNYQRVPILQQLSTNDFYMQVRNNTLNKNRNIFSSLFFYVSFTGPPPLYRLVSHFIYYILIYSLLVTCVHLCFSSLVLWSHHGYIYLTLWLIDRVKIRQCL
jgi:hypothetical protein